MGQGTTDRANSVLTAQFATYELAMANALGKLGGKSRQLEGQQDFLTTLKATKEEVIGGYVDADLATESANLQHCRSSNSLQFRQSVLPTRDHSHYLVSSDNWTA